MLLEYVVLDEPAPAYGPSLIEIVYSEEDHEEIQQSDEELDQHHHIIETLEDDYDVDDVDEDIHEEIDYIVSNESEQDFHRNQESPNVDFNEINVEYIESAATNDNQKDNTMLVERPALQSLPRKDIVSYQRFGRLNTKILANPSFKCHLCGFNCCYKESLLKHFNLAHPQ